MQKVNLLLLALGIAACSSGGGGGSGGSGGPVLPMLVMSQEESLSKDDARLKNLCRNSSEASQDIDSRLNNALRYSGSIALHASGKDMTANGNGSWTNSALELAPDTVKHSMAFNLKLSTSNGQSQETNNVTTITRKCTSTNPRSCSTTSSSNNSSNVPSDLAQLVSNIRYSIGKVNIGGREFQAIRQLGSASVPTKVDGRDVQMNIDLEVISIPELPAFTPGVLGSSEFDCGQFGAMKMSANVSDNSVRMGFAMLLEKVEGSVEPVVAAAPVIEEGKPVDEKVKSSEDKVKPNNRRKNNNAVARAKPGVEAKPNQEAPPQLETPAKEEAPVTEIKVPETPEELNEQMNGFVEMSF